MSQGNTKDVIMIDDQFKSLLGLMTNQPPAIRQGALEEVIKLLNSKTDLSKQDIRMVSKRMLPPPRVVVDTQPSKSKKKAPTKKPRALDKRIIALQELHDPSNREIGSQYAIAMKLLRTTIKAEKSASKSK